MHSGKHIQNEVDYPQVMEHLHRLLAPQTDCLRL